MAEGKLDEKWTKTLSVGVNETSAPLVIPGNVDKISCVAVPSGGGTAKVQYTMNNPTDVVANPSGATWVDWSEGAVTATTAKTFVGAMSCLRLVGTVGAATLHIAGQRLR